MTYIGVYIIKSAHDRQLRACCSGILQGLSKTEIINRFPDKLTPEELRRLGALNVRRKIRFGR